MIKKHSLKKNMIFSIIVFSFLLTVSFYAFGDDTDIPDGTPPIGRKVITEETMEEMIDRTTKELQNSYYGNDMDLRITEINGGTFAKVFVSRTEELISLGTQSLGFIKKLMESEGSGKITYEDHFHICSAFENFHESTGNFIFEIKIVNKLIDPTDRHNYQFTDFFLGQNFLLDYLIPIGSQNTLGETFCDFSLESVTLEDWLIPELSSSDFKGFVDNHNSLLSKLKDMRDSINDIDQYSGESVLVPIDREASEIIRDYFTGL